MGGAGREGSSRPSKKWEESSSQIIKVVRSADLSDNLIAELVREVAKGVDNAWGQREPRCYNHANRDPERQLPINKMRWFFS